jgi:serine/threonine-protein kinase
MEPPALVGPSPSGTPHTGSLAIEPIAIERTQRLETPPSPKKAPREASPEAETSTEVSSPRASSQKRLWIPAALALMLLGGVGGYVMLRPDPTPVPVTPPVVAEVPPVKEPPPTTPPEPPTAETPSENTPPPEEAPPPTEPSKPPEELVQTETPRDKPPKVRPPKVVGKGTLEFRVRPFATVFINGKNYGQTPFAPVELPSGTYNVKFVNEELNKTVPQTIVLKPGENKVIKINLAQ